MISSQSHSPIVECAEYESSRESLILAFWFENKTEGDSYDIPIVVSTKYTDSEWLRRGDCRILSRIFLLLDGLVIDKRDENKAITEYNIVRSIGDGLPGTVKVQLCRSGVVWISLYH